MNIVILNWPDGENNPFGYFNSCLKACFEQLGRPTRIIDLGDGFGQELLDAHSQGIDFVLTWQGLGIGATQHADKQSSTIWDDLKIPLLCLHGDHPAHAPGNHKAMSPWVQHIYGAASFASFANRHIPRKHPATYVPLPTIFPDTVKGDFEGDFFVFPKNINDNVATFDAWSRASQRDTALFLLEAADAIISEFGRGNRQNHHDIIDSMLTPQVLQTLQTELMSGTELLVRMHVHSMLDKVHRNAIAEHTVLQLRDVPIKIYGRGWDRFKTCRSPKHEFLAFGALSDNAFQYASNYGVLDAAPTNDGLHDRTTRAMANQSSFLIGSNWPHASLLGKDFGELFFDGTPHDVADKARQVMEAPKAHRERCREFALYYRANFSLFGFLKHLESISNSIRSR
ncbi:hypothetical protein AB6809_31320 [Paraburkholderia sp. RCC_158]|uniref:hypothetical protein n=1 Tax=Paraburkholderia sp. RCC_158 TaxID=3239220 RepID=UPI0035249BCC